jgi:hypothetical protein
MPHLWLTKMSQKLASPVQSIDDMHEAPTPSKVRQYGCASHVAHVYAGSQSALLVQWLVQAPALPAPCTAQYEYVASAHGMACAIGGLVLA